MKKLLLHQLESMLRSISRAVTIGRTAQRLSSIQVLQCKRSFHVQRSLLTQKTSQEVHAESQHRAELTEEYSDLEAEDEYYIDCSDIENKWPILPYESQQDMISYLNVKQEFGWMYLTHDEKRAIYYISYGKWGARDPATMNMAESVFKLMTSGLLFAAVGFTLINYAKDKEELAKLQQQ